MANPFLLTTIKMIKRHGQEMNYVKVIGGSYNVETGSVTNTTMDFSVTMYKKHIVANQYNYPNLIGKSSAMFYLANNALTFTPAIRDKIVVDSETYEVESIVEHRAQGQLVLYKIIAIKG